MASDNKEVFLIRIPGPINTKALDGCVIDLNQSTANFLTTPVLYDTEEETESQLSYSYEIDRNQSQENLNLIKLNKTSETEFKTDDCTQFSGYIQFRVKRNIGSDSEEFKPLPKRHVVEPIEHYIKSPSKSKQKSSPKKKRRRHQ